MIEINITKEVDMRVSSIAINPKKWAGALSLALKNSARSLWDLCKNPRLWIAAGVSLALHTVLLLVSVFPETAAARVQRGRGV